MNEIKATDIRGNKTISQQLLNRDQKPSIGLALTPSSPSLTLTNAAITFAGLQTKTISVSGVVTTNWYDDLGHRIMSGNLSSDVLGSNPATIVELETVVAASGSRNTFTLMGYNDKGQVAWTRDSASNTTWFAYNDYGQRYAVIRAVNNSASLTTAQLKNQTYVLGLMGNENFSVSYTAYSPEGQTLATWGNAYPVTYEYDDQNRMIGMATTRDENLRSVNLLTVFPQGKTLSTWQPAASDKIDITKWVYDSVTGLLTDKVYADGQGPSYAYTSEGKLSRRTWARGIITDYAYDFVGALTNVVYNDETPDFAYTYNRLGQQLSATSSVSTNLFVYSPVTLELDYELQNGTKIDRSTDGLGRNTGYALYNPVDPVNPVQEITYGFDSYGRFFFVNSGSSVVTNEFDYSYLPGSDLLAGYTASTPSTGSTILTASRSYELNRNLITAITNSVGSVPSVVSSFDYTNDTLGRRTARSDYYINRGSTETNTFGYNTFSEVTNAHMGTNTYSYAYDPIGNRDQCTIDNGQLIITNVYTANGLNQYTNITGGIATVPDHDLDGNLLSFNGWQYVWNGENRLVLASNNTAFVTYTYDHQGRMVTKTINDIVHRYLWDNFNIISKTIHHSSFTIHNSFVWGLDLSESLQGAGGVGGLLSVVKNQADLSAKAYYAAADANGNVTEYISANGTVEAHREYSAFGETLVSTGAMKDDFTHWWSTKPFDPVTGFSEYEYRKYLPPIGRWLSRDSIGIRGGLNEVGFVNNDGMNLWDLLGLENTEPKEEIECPCKQEDIDEIGRTMSAKAYALTKKTELVKKQIDPVTKEIETWTFHPEFSGRICCKDGEPYGTDPHKGDVYWVISEIDGKGGWKASAGLYDDNAPRCKEGETEVGIYHSHPDGAGFSPSDKLNKCIYLQNSGSFFCWRYLNGETCYWDPPKKEWVCKQK